MKENAAFFKFKVRDAVRIVFREDDIELNRNRMERTKVLSLAITTSAVTQIVHLFHSSPMNTFQFVGGFRRIYSNSFLILRGAMLPCMKDDVKSIYTNLRICQ